MILIREEKSSNIALEVYFIDFIVANNYFSVLPMKDMFKAHYKNKPVSKQSLENVENGLIQSLCIF